MNYKLATPTGDMRATTEAIRTLLQLAGAEPGTELFQLLDQCGTLTPEQTVTLADRVPTFGKSGLREDQARFILEAAAAGESLTVSRGQYWQAASKALPPREEWITATTEELDRTGWRKHPDGGDTLLAEYEHLLLDAVLSMEVHLFQGRAMQSLWRLYRSRRLPRLTDKNRPGVTDPARYEAMVRVIDTMDLSLGADTFRDICDDRVRFWQRTSDWLTTTQWAVSHSFKVCHDNQKSWGAYKVWLEPVGSAIRAAQTALEGEQR